MANKQHSKEDKIENINGNRVDFTGGIINSSGNLVPSQRRRTSNSSSNNNSSDDDNDDDKQYYDDGSELIKTEPESKQDRRGELRSLKSGGRNSTFDFLQDNLKDMTGARRLALKLLNKKWYNPHAGEVVKDDTRNQYKKTGTDQTSRAGSHSHNSSTTTFDFDGAVSGGRGIPSLETAWAYFEHVTLTRYVVHNENIDTSELSFLQRFLFGLKNNDERIECAKPGEKQRPTRLYDYLTTPHMQLGDFGLGFGLYFSTLRAITYILLIAGIMSIFNIYFFSSEEYDNSDYNLGFLLQGSAVCTQTEWVPCRDCNCTDKREGWGGGESSRCKELNSTDPGDENSTIAFVVKNQCLEDPKEILKLGWVNYAVLMFLLPAIYFWLGWYLDKHAVKFDEDEQTAQDYSILIKNPPPDATNPRKWRAYFQTTFPGVEVIAVTCNVNNDLLIKALVKRREVLRRMEVYLEKGTSMAIDNLAYMAAQEAQTRSKYLGALKSLFIPGLPELLSQLVSLNTSIKGLAQFDYPCTNVFVTFEHESHQRHVLSKLSCGKRYIKKNDPSGLKDSKYMFEGKVLNAVEATEPNSIRWQDLNVPGGEKLKYATLSSLVTIGSILFCAYIVSLAEDSSPGFGAAFTISVFNLSFPQLAKIITDFEGHRNESKLQISLYVKIAAFRWVNTSIVTTVITPFTHTLEVKPGLISQIAAIFFSEIVTTNLIQLTDVWGHIQRHLLAPRAKTQDSMNLFFKGLEVELAERYTNMTKIMFLAFWYSSIFPGGFLFAAAALTVNYYTDRFSLMRSWQRAPRVGKEISIISLNYFFSTSLFFLALMSSFYWSAFPFDNLCPTDERVGYNGTYSISNETSVVVDEDSSVWRFCSQDFILGPGRFFDYPFIYKEGDLNHGDWMTEEQQFLSRLFGWTSVGFIVMVSLKFLYNIIIRVRLEYVSSYNPKMENGEAQETGFHDVASIAGYVPQVRSSQFSYPLILCDCSKLGSRLFDWTDADHDFVYYDLTKDADYVLVGSSSRQKNTFDRVKYWPPKKYSQRQSCRILQVSPGKRNNVFNSSER